MNEKSLAETTEATFADVFLPLPLPKPFTYRVSKEQSSTIKRGSRVLVQFGKKRILTAIVSFLHNNQPEIYEAKPIIDILDDEPLVTTYQLNLIEWVSQYYMCHPGEVLNASIPSGLKLSSESRLQLNPDFDENSPIPFALEELAIIKTIESQTSLSYEEIPKLSGIKSPLRFVKSLLEKNRILLFEEIREKYIPKKIKKLRLNAEFANQNQLKGVFEKLKNKPKQTDLLLKLLSVTPLSSPELLEKGVEKSFFNEMAGSEFSLRSLIKEEIFLEFTEIVPRFPDEPSPQEYHFSLSPAQTIARDSILENFEHHETVLLHGVTGSGKTEIYIDLISKAINSGSQVLFLVPEIALTTQIVSRLKKVFGNKLGVYHSKFSDNERVEVYKGLLAGKFNVIVGVRSSVFLPFDNLGLIIVDEEHETSYKQQEPAPRYNARDTALILARIHHAKTLLGTATPSVETYFNCKEGKWGLVPLTERFAEARLPDISLLNLRRERKLKQMRNDFSLTLLEEIKSVIDRKEQVILFQNRRGYAPYLCCDDCAHVFSCKNCDVSLTYHMHSNELRCHYCGHIELPATNCPACGSSKIKSSGFGTEKLEDDLKIFIPEAKIARMDLDTTRKKRSFEEILSDFGNGNTDILIGTQMVTKGLDFDRVSLVGVFDSDRMIFYPDFRSYERAFQILTQVSGRAGRKDKKGKVIIQTDNPDNNLYRLVTESDYEKLYLTEINERQRFFYPPFSRMIKITVRNPEKQVAEKTAVLLHKRFLEVLGKERVLGPESPVINKIRNYFILNIYIKLEREKINLQKIKSILSDIINNTLNNRDFRNSQVISDVDPV